MALQLVASSQQLVAYQPALDTRKPIEQNHRARYVYTPYPSRKEGNEFPITPRLHHLFRHLHHRRRHLVRRGTPILCP